MKRGVLNRAQGKKNAAKKREAAGKVRESTTSAEPTPEPYMLPYGKVESANLSSLLQESEPLKHIVRDASTLTYEKNTYIFTTQPLHPLHATLADFPDGWTECLLVSADAKRTIISTPDFPQPIPRPSEKRYHIDTTPTMGLGMFAIRDLGPAEFIFCERPLIIVPRAARSPGVNILPGVTLTAEQEIQVALMEYEKILNILFGRLQPENQKAFMSLANSHTEDGSGPIMGRIRTNGYAVTGLRESGPYGDYSGVCDILSRINHSCNPNVSQTFDMVSFCFILRANRPIKAGEEMTVAYTDVLAPYAIRKKALEPYGFHCTCSSCSGPTESDLIRTNIKKSVTDADALMISWLADPSLPDYCVLKFCSEWLSIIQKHKLESTQQHDRLVKLCYDAAVALGDEALFAVMSIEHGLSLSVGLPMSEVYREIVWKIVDPQFSRSSAAWGSRKASGNDEIPDLGWASGMRYR